METASSSYESNSNGSEFGDFDNHKELYNKLPQIKQEMARILNLKVKYKIKNILIISLIFHKIFKKIYFRVRIS